VQHGPADAAPEDRNVQKHITVRKGDGEDRAAFEARLAACAYVVEGTYETQAQEQCYIETQGIIARAVVDAADAPSAERPSVPMWPSRPFRIEIEGSLQCPYYVHKALTSLFALPDDGVRVTATLAGGGFGGKEEYPSIIAGHAALLALKTRRPVKMVYERAEDMVATTKRHPSFSRVRTGHDADGRIVCAEVDCRMDGGAYVTLSPVVLSRGIIHAVGPYDVAHVRVDGRSILTNTPPHGAFRGFGAPQTIFAFERHLDRAAAAIGIDPVALRRRNLLRRGGELAVSQRVDEPIALEAWMEEALEAFDWQGRKARAEAANAAAVAAGGAMRRGVGLATFMHGAGFTGSGEDYMASKVLVRAVAGEGGGGAVEVCTAQTEIGQGSVTVFSQIAADAVGLDIADVRIAVPDTDHVPNSGPTVASRTSMVVGHLVARAVEDLVGRLERAGLLGAADLRDDADVPDFDAPGERPSAMVEGRGWRYRPDALRRALAAAAASGDEAVCEGWSQYQRPPGGAWDDKVYKGVAYGTYAWATYLCEVEVDTSTGETRVLDFLASQEIGRVLNPLLAHGQIEGGVVQAIGWALLEDCVWVDGGLRNGNMTNYVVPTAADVPPIAVRFQESPYAYGPWGAKGIGELPMDGPAPAIANAVAHATGLDVCAIPITPERVVAGLLDAERGVAGTTEAA
jgi:CO/xanthine dehydrogenase Mo-binding subunit